MHTAQALMLQVGGMKMTLLYFLVKRDKFFYLQDTKLGEPWKIVQSIQRREVFDVPEVGGGESNDNTKDSDALQQEVIVDVVSINVVDNIIDYCIGDVETKVVLEGGTSRDANQNEEYDIPDVDLDMDYDM